MSYMLAFPKPIYKDGEKKGVTFIGNYSLGVFDTRLEAKTKYLKDNSVTIPEKKAEDFINTYFSKECDFVRVVVLYDEHAKTGAGSKDVHFGKTIDFCTVTLCGLELPACVVSDCAFVTCAQCMMIQEG
jgi:hypothetical protein